MFWYSSKFTRRKFLKGVVAFGGAAILQPFNNVFAKIEDWPDADRLGRVCVGKVDIRSKPSVNAPSVGVLYEDNVVVWLRELSGEIPGGRISARWVETPDGYIYSPSLQPVKYFSNIPVNELPNSSIGQGFWAEVTSPYVDLYIHNPPARSIAIRESLYPRLYYSQVLWVDDIKIGQDDQVYYRINEKYGNPGDIFWAEAKSFRPITADEISPISPDIEDKKIIVDVTRSRQILSCYEGNNEVYYCQISSGAKWNAYGESVEEWGTPIGPHPIWRKLISVHMAGGSTGGGYDLPGIAWTSLFTSGGVAIHSTFWHNDYGTPRSHGCINAKPEDAKWIFRWTSPQITLDPGDLTVSMPGGTIIDIKEQ